MSLLKRLWRWLIRYQPLPCPRCNADLRDQPGAFHGDGLRGGERHYICQCGRYVVYCERTDGPWRLLYDRDEGFYSPRPRQTRKPTPAEVAVYRAAHFPIDGPPSLGPSGDPQAYRRLIPKPKPE